MIEPNDVKSIFLEAVEKPVPERAAYLDEVVGGDTALRVRVEALLAAHDNPDSFLQEPGAQLGATVDLFPAEPPLAERPGAIVGRYKLLEQIGEGGMGVVYMAEQQVPIRRRVALKIIKAGMDSRQIIARFEAERQALALMDHSNIARVLDAGATDSGRPFFVMELVRGIPITEYCDQNNLQVQERLEVFVQVCQAVQHAHQKGIIHRDIKPSNVLVTVNDGRAVPKVIDFGVAKATNQQLTEKTLFTAFAQMVGTPLYMSPEQAEMTSLDIDTRTDIYSLGVLLYELLTGTTPFNHERLRAVAYAEMVRIIREEEPPKPSTRISTLGELRTATAAQRQIDARRLSQLIQGDLDWIVMRCLEKDRQRRYDSASALAQDIGRHLVDQPVEARAPTARYRFSKFARRNKGALVVVSLVLAGLVTLLVGLAVSNHIIAAERNQKIIALALAEAQSKRAQSNLWRANSAIRDLIGGTARGKDNVPLAMRQRFSDEATKYYQGLIQDSAADPSSRYETGVGYRMLGTLQINWKDVDSAEKCYRKAIAVFDALVADDPGTQTYRHQLGLACYALGDMLGNHGHHDEGLAQLSRAKEVYEKLLSESPDAFDFADELATVLQSMCRLQGRIKNFQDEKVSCSRAVELLTMLVEGRSGPNPYPRGHSRYDLWKRIGDVRQQTAFSLFDAQRYEEAELAFHQTIAIFERAGDSDPQNAYFLYFLADSHRRLGLLEIDRKRLDHAEIELRRAVEIHQQCMNKFPGELLDYPHRGACYRELNRLLVSTGKADKAKSLIRDIKIDTKNIPLRIFRADLLRDTGDSQQAFTEYTDVIKEAPQTSTAWAGRAVGYFHLEQWEPAIADFSKAIELDPKVHQNWFDRGSAYIALSQWDKAASDFTKIIDGWPDDIWAWYSRAQIYAVTNRTADAISDLTQAIGKGFRDPMRMKTEVRFGAIRGTDEFKKLLSGLEARFRPASNTIEGAAYLRNAGELEDAIKTCSGILSREPDNDAAWLERGHCNLQKSAFANAIDDYTHAIKLKPNDWWSWHERAYCYQRLGQHEKCIVDQSRAIELRDQDAEQHLRRGNSYCALGNLQKAEADYSRAIEMNPSGWSNWFVRAKLYDQQHKSEKARSDFTNAVKVAIDPGAQNQLAWTLATDPEPLWRDPAIAVHLAEKAVAVRPMDGMIWNTLGVAKYRAGDWQGSVASLKKSVELRHGGDSADWFFLAMAHWHLNEKEDARKWYGKSVEWMDKNQPKNGDLVRFRHEADELLNGKPAVDVKAAKTG